MNVDARTEQALASVTAEFPFADYIDPKAGAHLSVAQTVQRFLEPGARILDFGAGPVDKTAVLASLGFDCTAMDDLGDGWHQDSTARQSILDFAQKMNIDYITLDGGPLPDAGPFDMVMLHDVLEHLHDSPRGLLTSLLEQVREGGYLFVTVPNHVNLRKRLDVVRGRTSHPRYEAYFWHPDPWRGHVREYTGGDCEALAKALGLDVCEVQGVHHMLGKVPAWSLRPYLLVSRLMPSTRDTWSMVARKPHGWVPKPTLDGEEMLELTGLKTWGDLGH